MPSFRGAAAACSFSADRHVPAAALGYVVYRILWGVFLKILQVLLDKGLVKGVMSRVLLLGVLTSGYL